MSIGAILRNKGDTVHSVACGTTLREAVAMLARHRIGAMPVLEGGKVAGIVSERDVIQCLEREGAAVLDKPVEAAMTAPAITVTSDLSVLVGLSQMTRSRVRHLPVVEDGKLVGIVSIGDLVKYRMDRIESEAEALRNYIQSA
jgi:CBS domain-containing protein